MPVADPYADVIQAAQPKADPYSDVIQAAQTKSDPYSDVIQAASAGSQEATGSVPTGKQPQDSGLAPSEQSDVDYLKNAQSKRQLTTEEQFRLDSLANKDKWNAPGTTQDPIMNQAMVSPDVIKAGLWANPITGTAMAVNRALMPQTEKGIEGGVSESIAGLTSPNNVALLATTPIMPSGIVGKVGGTALGAYFEAQAIKQFPDEWAQFQKTTDWSDKWKLGVQMAASLGLPLTAIAHVIDSGKPVPSETGSEQTQPQPAADQATQPSPQPIQSQEPSPVAQDVPAPVGKAPVSSQADTTPTGGATQPQDVGKPSGSDGAPVEDIGTSGVANRVYAEKAAKGLSDEIPSGEGLSPEEVIDMGREAIDSGRVDPSDVAQRFAQDKRLSAEDFGVLRAKGEDLDQAAAAAEREVVQDPDNPMKRQAADQAAQEADNWHRNVVQPAKTATSDIFRGMQGETDLDTGSFFGLKRAFQDVNGREPSPPEQIKMADRVADVQHASDLEAYHSQRLAKAIDREFPQIKKSKETVEQTKQRLADQIAEDTRKLTPCEV